MSLKILHISPYYLPDVAFGGPVFSVSALCEALAKENVEVTVFTVGYNDDVNYPITEQLNGVTVKYFKRDWGKPCQVSTQLWKALENEVTGFDLVHLHTWWNILIFKSIQIIKARHVPLVVAPRGMLSDYSFTHRKTFLKRWFQSIAGKKLLEGVSLHATADAEAKDMALRTGRPVETISVMPNLLALSSSEYAEPAGGYKLGFLSRLHHKKGIEVLLDAVAQCPEVDELVIGGAGDPLYEQQLKTQIKNLGIEEKVRFVGWIRQENKEEFFKQFHVFALPSFNENFANVVAEAWASGKPVIVSTEVGLSDYVEKYHLGWICKAEVGSVVEKIKQALRERDKWPQMGMAALKLVDERFSDAQMVKDYLKLYQRMVKDRAAGVEQKITTQVPATGLNSKLQNDSYILGINAYHADASAALLHNGKLVAAIEEERFRRVKHWAGFPTEAVEFCLNEAGISLQQVSKIAIGRDPKAKWLQKARFMMQRPGALAFAMRGRLSNAAAAVSVENELATIQDGSVTPDLKEKIVYVEHHRSHLASAFYASAFPEAALLSIDGSGDFSTTMMGIGRNRHIEVLQSIDFPHSLGIFYTAFTQLLGFPYYGDEYKVMGLAPYGNPVYTEQLKQVIRWEKDGTFRLEPQWFRPPEKGYVLYDSDHRPQVPLLFAKALEDTFGKERAPEEAITQHHKDLAASVQRITEETIFHMLRHLHTVTGLNNVCVAGGVAQNSVANGKIVQNTPFKKVFIPPAGHDAGLSMGAAMYVHHNLLDQPRNPLAISAYSGSHYSNNEIQRSLDNKSLKYIKVESMSELCEKVAACISEGGVVGWFRGRCEFGPRALGNRSILADPRRPDAKELINQKIKRRENFRPFAPSILKEYTDEYFEQSDDVPFMEKVFPVKKEKQSVIPAVTHVDGSGRLQTVTREMNADFYELIDTFRRQTGVPVLLNTSFNENEPIVNTPVEALNCFLRTRMDMLVLQDYLITRDD